MEGEFCHLQGRGGVLPTVLPEAVGEEQAAVPYLDEGGSHTEDPAFLFQKLIFRL